MKPSRFAYHDPPHLEGALQLLGELGDDAKVLAGGQSLVPMLSMRLAYPEVLIDLGRIEGLGEIADQGGELSLGALVRQTQAEDSRLVAEACPLLARALPWIAHRSVRNRGTIGGSLAHADPAAEIPAVMTALGARITARSATSAREIPIEDFFEMPLVSALAAEEILTSVRVPRARPGSGSGVAEVARRHGDFALAGVAASLSVGAEGTISDARLVSFATGPVPQRLLEAEGVLAGAPAEAELLREAGELAAAETQAGDDLHASADYRRAVTAVLVRRAVRQALAEAGRPLPGGPGHE